MKILDRYILTSFIKTFGTVFIILFLIFVLQGIWLFIAELAGKDLDAWVVIKFLGFYSPTMVPLVLPLSILLASIMTFGSFAENYEFAAMKSSGISLGRAMRGLTIFIFCLSIVAFFFANNVIPQAQYRFSNLRKNIFQRKPAMAIVEGQFNAVGSFNIRVEKKGGENGEKLTGVTIHKRVPGAINATIIRSKTGLLKSSEKSNLLQLELYDGYYYEDITTKKPGERQKMPFAKSSFTRQLMNIDLTALNNTDVDDEQISHTNNMLNVSELNYTLDSLEGNYDTEAKNIADNLVLRPQSVFTPILSSTPNAVNDSLRKKPQTPKDLLSILDKNDKIRLLDMAANNVSSTQYVVTSGKNGLEEKVKNINSHWLALYDKFVIAYACIMMFFIGAPLGAIIRKGGLGLPIVFAVLIFIIFHFINTFGKKLAQENGIPPLMGSWMSSFVLTPFAILFTYRATNDMNLAIDMDWLTVPMQKLFGKKKTEIAFVKLETFAPVEDEEWQLMTSYDDDKLRKIVRNAQQFNYTEMYRKKALKILDSRGITQDELKAEGNLYNAEYMELETLYDRYRIYSGIALFMYVVFALLFAVKFTVGILIARVAIALLLYFLIFETERNLQGINKITNREGGLPTALVVIIGPVFYIFFYFFNKKNVKEALAQYSNYDDYHNRKQN